MPLKIKNKQTILFIGDSITDCGRRSTEKPLGNGYVQFFHDILIVREPFKKVNIVNKGIAGNTIPDLQMRWTDDVLYHKPEWLVIEIGINDLFRTLDPKAESILPEDFCEIYDSLILKTKSELPKCQILLVDPFYISTDKNRDSFRKTVLDLIPKYIDAVHKMSRKHGTYLLKTHEMFQSFLKYHEAETFCPEPVHPYPLGHLAIAETIYSILSK